MTSLYCLVQRANDPPGKTINYQFISLVWCSSLQFDRVTNRSAFCIYCMIHLPERLKRPHTLFRGGLRPGFFYSSVILLRHTCRILERYTCRILQLTALYILYISCGWLFWFFLVILVLAAVGIVVKIILVQVALVACSWTKNILSCADCSFPIYPSSTSTRASILCIACSQSGLRAIVQSCIGSTFLTCWMSKHSCSGTV